MPPGSWSASSPRPICSTRKRRPSPPSRCCGGCAGRRRERLERDGGKVRAVFLLCGEEVGVSAARGVYALRGVVGSPGRRQALLTRLWSGGGVGALHDSGPEEAH